MILSDIPPHVTEINPPYFTDSVGKTLSDEKNKEIEVSDYIEPLHALDFWDGPLSGIVYCLGSYYFCKAIYVADRKYWASWLLSDEQSKEAMQNHSLWVNSHEHNQTCTNFCKTLHIKDPILSHPSQTYFDFLKTIDDKEIFGILENPFWQGK